MLRRKRQAGVVVACLCGVLMLTGGAARADSFFDIGFEIFEPSSGITAEATTAVAAMTLTVWELDSGGGRFELADGAAANVKVLNFFLEDGLGSVIENVAFDSANSVGVVNFGSTGQPAPPGGANLTPRWWNDDTFFSATKSGSGANFLHGGETVAFSFDFVSDTGALLDIQNVIADNNLDHNGRVAIHVGGFTGSVGSTTAITTVQVDPGPGPGPNPNPNPNPAPLPGAVWMGLALIGGMGAARAVRRARRRV